MVQHRCVGLVLLACALAAGCTSTSTPSPSDAGAFDAGASDAGDFDAGPPPYKGVHGRLGNTYEDGNEVVFVPNVKRCAEISALVPHDNTQASFPGTIDADGQFWIPDVPEGKFLLKCVGQPVTTPEGTQSPTSLFEHTGRTIDLGDEMSYRSDAVEMTKPTTIHVDATLAFPIQVYTEDDNGIVEPDTDDFTVVSRSAGVMGILSPFFAQQWVMNGATSTTGLSFGANNVFAMNGFLGLVDTTKGDDFWMLHNVAGTNPESDGSDLWEGSQYKSAMAYLKPATFKMTDGAESELTGTFQTATGKQVTLDFRGAEFVAQLPNVTITSGNANAELSMEAAAPVAKVGTWATLASMGANGRRVYAHPECAGSKCDETMCTSGCDLGTFTMPGDHSQTLLYINPFPWGEEYVSYIFSFFSNLKPVLPETTSESAQGYFSARIPASEAVGKPLKPTLGLPTNIFVGGKETPVDQRTIGVGTTPLISWKAPSLGTPSRYNVRIYDLTDLGTSRRRMVSNSYVADTQLRVPAGVMLAGRNYSVQIIAQQISDYDSSKPFSYARRMVYAAMFTGVFSP
jgi:hypothetical protein